MGYDHALNESLREEVQALRKKVVNLETAEADNVKLRKELSKLKVSYQNERSELELDFMNQLTGVARENALQLEELEGQLSECKKVNCALNEQLKQAPTHENTEKRILAIEEIHRKELAQVIDSNKLELEKTRKDLARVMASRDEVSEELEDVREKLKSKADELEATTLSSTHVSDVAAEMRLAEETKKSEELKRQNIELRSKCQSLEAKIVQQEATMKTLRTRNSSDPGQKSTRVYNSDLATSRKASSIIKQLEQNMCDTSTKKTSFTTSNFKKRIESDWNSNDRSQESLRRDLVELSQKLELERAITSDLRSEIATLKTLTQQPDNQGNREGTLDNQNEQTTGQAISSPRTPVRGLVNTFEKRISVNRNAKQSEITSYGINSLDELQEALHHERQQVYELEDELTRQCEINCSLLKEIASVTTEAEESRARCVDIFESTEANVTTALKVHALQDDIEKAMEAKAEMQSNFDKEKEVYKNEIDSLKKQIVELESMVLEHKASLLSSNAAEVQQTKMEAEQLKAQLLGAQRSLAEKNDEINFFRKEKEALNQKHQNDRENHRAKFTAMELELEELRSMELEANSTRISVEELKDSIATMKCRLDEADATNEALVKEREKTKELGALVESLEEKLKLAKEKMPKPASENIDKSSIEVLSKEVVSVRAELKRTLEERDALVRKDKVHNNKFDALRMEISEKVQQFESIHLTDKEEILRLREQVKALEQELQGTLDSVEAMREELEEKKKSESEISDSQRKKQQSLDSRMNKLQQDLTNARVSEAESKKKCLALKRSIEALKVDLEASRSSNEKSIEEITRTIRDKENVITRLAGEKEQLVLSMKDMTSSRRDEIDELQTELMEMSNRAANQAREAQSLRVQLEESSYRKEEVDRLRSKVRELSENLASQSGASNEGDIATQLQIENSGLRQKLRETALNLRNAEEKMNQMVAEKSGSSKSTQVLRERNASLKFEVEKLTKKLKKITDRKLQKTGDKQSQTRKDQYIYNDKVNEESEATRFII